MLGTLHIYIFTDFRLTNKRKISGRNLLSVNLKRVGSSLTGEENLKKSESSGPRTLTGGVNATGRRPIRTRARLRSGRSRRRPARLSPRFKKQSPDTPSRWYPLRLCRRRFTGWSGMALPFSMDTAVFVESEMHQRCVNRTNFVDRGKKLSHNWTLAGRPLFWNI
jgi:hypothetical protein